MVVMEVDMREGVTGKGFQWDIMELQGGLEAVRIEDNDLLDEEQRDEVWEDSVNFTSLWLTSFLLRWVKLKSFLLTNFFSFTISASSLVLFIFKEECSDFSFLRVSRVFSRFLFRL